MLAVCQRLTGRRDNLHWEVHNFTEGRPGELDGVPRRLDLRMGLVPSDTSGMVSLE